MATKNLSKDDTARVTITVPIIFYEESVANYFKSGEEGGLQSQRRY